MRSHFFRIAAVIFVCAGPSIRSSADLIFTLSPSIMPANPGGSAIFSGTLSYTGPDPGILLNDIDISFDGGAGAFLTGDTNIFFSNVPGVFNIGDTWSSPIFGVNVDGSTVPGTYTGTATILGGANPLDLNPLASQAFTLSVLATPEPGTMVLYLAGGLVIYSKVRRRKRE